MRFLSCDFSSAKSKSAIQNRAVVIIQESNAVVPSINVSDLFSVHSQKFISARSSSFW